MMVGMSTTAPTKFDRRHDMRRKVETPDPRATCGDALYKASSSTIDRICDHIRLVVPA